MVAMIKPTKQLGRKQMQRINDQIVADMGAMSRIVEMCIRDMGAIATIAKTTLDDMGIIIMPGTRKANLALKAILGKSAQYKGFKLQERQFDKHGKPIPVQGDLTAEQKKQAFEDTVIAPIAKELAKKPELTLLENKNEKQQ